MPKKKHTPNDAPTCREVRLDPDLALAAAYRAIEIHPPNGPAGSPTPEHIAVYTQKYWGDRVRDITVGFMDGGVSQAMMDKTLAYMNRWNFTKARFRATQTSPMVRISFGPGGYYSYLGTDILGIPANVQTMNLEAFSLNTPDSEWERVVPHETGHTLGCPHEQQRPEILALLDVQKTIAYFMATQGWSAQQVRQQVLVPLDMRSMMNGGSATADQTSIMCYEFPGSVTKSGLPIVGGKTLSPFDRAYMATVYPADPVTPPPVVPPPVIPPAPGAFTVSLSIDPVAKKVTQF